MEPIVGRHPGVGERRRRFGVGRLGHADIPLRHHGSNPQILRLMLNRSGGKCGDVLFDQGFRRVQVHIAYEHEIETLGGPESFVVNRHGSFHVNGR